MNANQKEYKNLTPFKMCVIENFPFIEEDFDAITNYQLFCKVVEYLNKTIDRTNEFGKEIEKISNYFNSLNVQDEINNKLDEMTQNGQLQEIISIYLNTKTIISFNSVADMKSSNNLINGVTCETLGFYDINDGGKSKYFIRNRKIDEEIDESIIISLLDENLVAELIIENNTLNFKQLGAREQNQLNEKFDNIQYFNIYKNLIETRNNKIKLYIPSGIWYSSPFEISNRKGFDISGDFGFNLGTMTGTVITTIADNQDYLFNLGNNIQNTKSWNLNNIIFSSADFIYDNNINMFRVSRLKPVNNYLVQMKYLTCGISDNLFFLYIKGEPLRITSCWENYYKLINFREINNLGGNILNFYTKDTTLSPNANISACTFENLMFEAVLGNLINNEVDNDLGNCIINNLFFEDHKLEFDSIDYQLLSNSTYNENTSIKQAIINIKGSFNCDINNLILNNFSYYFGEYGNLQYTYNTIFKIFNSARLCSSVNNINVVGMIKNSNIVLNDENEKPVASSYLNINNIINYTKSDFIFNTKVFPFIQCKSRLTTLNKNNYILPNNVTPFNKILYRSESSTRGLLYYDENSQTNEKLCLKMKDTTNIHAQTIFASKNIKIRYKVPINESVRIVLTNPISGNYKGLTLTGTGEFAIYSIENIEELNIGDEINITFSGASTTTDCLLDYLIFY